MISKRYRVIKKRELKGKATMIQLIVPFKPGKVPYEPERVPFKPEKVPYEPEKVPFKPGFLCKGLLPMRLPAR